MNFLCLKHYWFPISKFRLLVIANYKLKFLLWLFGLCAISNFRYFRHRKPDTQFFVEIICWLSRFRFPTFRISGIRNPPNYFNKNINRRSPISELSKITNSKYPKSLWVCFYPSLFISNFKYYKKYDSYYIWRNN